MGYDFSKFPVTEELLNNSSLKGKEEHIVWTQIPRQEAAQLIAEMHLMCLARLSDSIPLRNRSSISANYYFTAVGDKLHAFAKVQGRAELNLSPDDVHDLFKHKSLLGGHGRYRQMELKNK